MYSLDGFEDIAKVQMKIQPKKPNVNTLKVVFPLRPIKIFLQ